MLVLDLVHWESHESARNHLAKTDSKILALTPVAFQTAMDMGIEPITFFDIVSPENYRQSCLAFYSDMFQRQRSDEEVAFSIKLAAQMCTLAFVDALCVFLEKQSATTTYVTDRPVQNDGSSLFSNRCRVLDSYFEFDAVKLIRTSQPLKKKISNLLKNFSDLTKYSYVFRARILRRGMYDWAYIPGKIQRILVPALKGEFKYQIKNSLYESICPPPISIKYEAAQTKLNNRLIWMNPELRLQLKNVFQKFDNLSFYQHGSYIYKHYFLRDVEVFNKAKNYVYCYDSGEYLRSLGAKNVIVKGSPRLQKKKRIAEGKENLVLYITHGTDYGGYNSYLDFPDSVHSPDGVALYKWHVNSIIKLTHLFPKKRIIVKLHPLVATTGLEVPLTSRFQRCPNVQIETQASVGDLIKKSKHILCDYITTELTDLRALAQKRLVVYSGGSTPIPIEKYPEISSLLALCAGPDNLPEAFELAARKAKEYESKNYLIDKYFCIDA